jgi:hypothetical protein
MQQEMAQPDVQTRAVRVAVAMAGDRIGLPVMFRKDELTGRVFAMLPTLPGDKSTFSKCVVHVLGGVITAENVYNTERESVPATPTEYRALMEELQRTYAGNHLIGYVSYNQWFNRTRAKNVMIAHGLME